MLRSRRCVCKIQGGISYDRAGIYPLTLWEAAERPGLAHALVPISTCEPSWDGMAFPVTSCPIAIPSTAAGTAALPQKSLPLTVTAKTLTQPPPCAPRTLPLITNSPGNGLQRSNASISRSRGGLRESVGMVLALPLRCHQRSEQRSHLSSRR